MEINKTNKNEDETALTPFGEDPTAGADPNTQAPPLQGEDTGEGTPTGEEAPDYEKAGMAVMDSSFQQSLASLLGNVQKALQTQDVNDAQSALYEAESFLQTVPGNEDEELPAPTTEPPPIDLAGGVDTASGGGVPDLGGLAGGQEAGGGAGALPPDLGLG